MNTKLDYICSLIVVITLSKMIADAVHPSWLSVLCSMAVGYTFGGILRDRNS